MATEGLFWDSEFSAGLLARLATTGFQVDSKYMRIWEGGGVSISQPLQCVEGSSWY